jgi:hypothetical protein
VSFNNITYTHAYWNHHVCYHPWTLWTASRCITAIHQKKLVSSLVGHIVPVLLKSLPLRCSPQLGIGGTPVLSLHETE